MEILLLPKQKIYTTKNPSDLQTSKQIYEVIQYTY